MTTSDRLVMLDLHLITIPGVARTLRRIAQLRVMVHKQSEMCDLATLEERAAALARLSNLIVFQIRPAQISSTLKH